MHVGSPDWGDFRGWIPALEQCGNLSIFATIVVYTACCQYVNWRRFIGHGQIEGISLAMARRGHAKLLTWSAGEHLSCLCNELMGWLPWLVVSKWLWGGRARARLQSSGWQCDSPCHISQTGATSVGASRLISQSLLEGFAGLGWCLCMHIVPKPRHASLEAGKALRIIREKSLEEGQRLASDLAILVFAKCTGRAWARSIRVFGGHYWQDNVACHNDDNGHMHPTDAHSSDSEMWGLSVITPPPFFFRCSAHNGTSTSWQSWQNCTALHYLFVFE